MRISYRSRLPKCVDASLPAVYEQAGEPAFCCDAMRQQWGRLLGFGTRDCSASTSREVCLYASRPQANGTSMLELVTVDYCPFCGEAVETCRVK